MSVIAGAMGAAAAGYAAWWFRSRPVRGRQPVTHPDTTECRTAVHEAGHAVLALRCSVASRIHITIRRDELEPHQAGAVHYDLVHWDRTQAMWCGTVIYFGGVAAEIAIYGKFRSAPAAYDLAQALECAREVVKAGALVPPWRNTGPRRALDFRRMFREQITDDELLVLQRAYDTARLILERHHELCGKLTSALFACGTMDEKTLDRWAGDRSFIRAVSTFQARFL